MHQLELRGVSKRFPSHRAVDDLSLQIERGAFFSLLGPSGCGKTTTLRLIAGFEQPTSGELFLNGVRLNDQPPYARNVSTVFQSYALFPHLTVEENVEFGLKQKRIGERGSKVREVLALLQLSGKEKRYPQQISGGERQRVALARSLVLRPEVLLLDEPLAALDPNLRKQVRGELKALQRQVGITFVFVTHDQEEALSLSDRIAVLRQGRLQQVGSPTELYFRPVNRFVAGFLGAVNWIGPVGIRPESLTLTRARVDGCDRVRRAVVQSSLFLGNCYHVTACLESGETVLAELARGREQFAPGEAVQAAWSPADEMLLPAEAA